MRKNDLNIAIGVAGLAAAILLFRGSGKADDSGYGGAFPLPLVMQSPGAVEPTQTLSTAQGLAPETPSFSLSNIFSAYGGSSPQSKKELSIIQAAGFSTEGLSGSYNPSTNTYYGFAPEMATVEKTLIQRAGFDTTGLQGSYDPSSGKITTFAGSGSVSYAPTKKEAATIDPESGMAYRVGSKSIGIPSWVPFAPGTRNAADDANVRVNIGLVQPGNMRVGNIMELQRYAALGNQLAIGHLQKVGLR